MILIKKNADIPARHLSCWKQYGGCYEMLLKYLDYHTGVGELCLRGSWSSTTGMVSGLPLWIAIDGLEKPNCWSTSYPAAWTKVSKVSQVSAINASPANMVWSSDEEQRWTIWYGMPCSFNFPLVCTFNLTHFWFIIGCILWFVVYHINNWETRSEPTKQRSLGWPTPTLKGVWSGLSRSILGVV